MAGFADTEALAAAYKSLQAEFTRRSQRLKQAEKRLDELLPELPSAKEQAAPQPAEGGADGGAEQTDYEAFLAQFPDADAVAVVRGAVEAGDFTRGGLTRQYVRQLKAQIEALREENGSEELLVKRARENGRVTEAIVRDYLSAVVKAGTASQPKLVGAAPVLPPSRPKSISEAGALATDIFNLKQ